MKSGVTLETSGAASRASGDRGITAALRDAWEHERGFPANIVNALRPVFNEIGLHFFKHRKRIIYISPIRPERHVEGRNFSEGIASILGTVEAQPKITRPQLAVKILGEQHDSPDAAGKKSALASDLHYLIQVGHVIEFHDGTLDLPMSPRAEKEEESGKSAAPTKAGKSEPKPKSEVVAAAARAAESVTSTAEESAPDEAEPISELVAETSTAMDSGSAHADLTAPPEAATASSESSPTTEMETHPMLATDDPNAALPPTEPAPPSVPE